MTRLAIMQGRLVPPVADRVQAFPRDRWEDEFPLARAAGLGAIEWIYDASGEGVNPLETDDGIERMRDLSRQHDVGVVSVCADYYMEHPLLKGTADECRARVTHLAWLLDRCRLAGVERVVLPFVDQSNVTSDAEQQALLALVESAAPVAGAAHVELHLEMSLPPAAFGGLLAQMPDECVKVNYDSGNSASLGYRLEDEFAAYGNRVGSVHVKDRLRGGGTVPLGTGDADLAGLFGALRRWNYGGDIVLQVARDKAGEEVEWARRNRLVVENLMTAWN